MRKTVCLLAALLLCLTASSAGATRVELEDGRYFILSLGGSYGYARDTAGNFYVWGDNQYGQLGRGYTNPEFSLNFPRAFETRNTEIDLSQVRDVIASTNYSFLWMEDGTLYGVGNSQYLSLARGEGVYTTHQRIDLPEKPAQVACGFGQVLVITEQGEVYAWGRNNKGQVGNGSTRHTMTPTKLSLQNIVQVCGGAQFSLALDSEGRLWGWGDNEFHIISPSKEAYYTTPVLIDMGDIQIASIEAGGYHAAVVDTEGRVWTWGKNDVFQLGYNTREKPVSQPTQVELPLPVKALSVYSSQNYAILSDGSLWSWGNNGYGQLGRGIRGVVGAVAGECLPGDVILAETGSMFAQCVLSDGTVLCAGFNNHAELGARDTSHRNKMTPNGLDLIVE